MATKSGRQERLLERQRGAGIRQLKNTGFALLLPGQEAAAPFPLAVDNSVRARKTPQPELLPLRSSRRTPAPEALTLQPSSGRTPCVPITKKRGRPRHTSKDGEGKATSNDEQQGAGKKRKLDTASRSKKPRIVPAADDENSSAPEVQVKDSQPTHDPNISFSMVGVKKRKKRRSIGQQSMRKTKSQTENPRKPARQSQRKSSEPEPPRAVELVRTPEPPEYSRITTPALHDREQSLVPRSLDAPAESDQNGAMPNKIPNKDVEGPKSKSRKRKREQLLDNIETRKAPRDAKESLGAVSQKDDLLARQAQPETRPKRGRKPGVKKKPLEEAVQLQDHTEAQQAGVLRSSGKDRGADQPIEGEEIENEASPAKASNPQEQPKPKKKKRRSIGQQRGRPKKKAIEAASPEKPTKENATVTQKAQEPKPKKKSTVSSTKPKAKPTQLPLPTEEEHLDAVANTSKDQVPQPEPIQPKKKRGRPRKADALKIAATAPQSSQSRARKPKQTKASAPRKAPPDTIPITFYAPPSPTASGTEAMIDLLSEPPPALFQKQAINAVDVLSQTCLEMLAKISVALTDKAHSSPDQKAEYIRRKKIVEMYSEELGDRLFQLTTTLNTNTSLAARVRKTAKEERELKKEVKNLEAEREKVRLRKEEMLKAKKARELEELLSGIKGAVKKGWELEAEATMEEV